MKRKKVEMTITEMLELENLLSLYGGAKQAKLCYAVARNLASIKAPLKAFRKALAPTEAMQEFDKEKMKLLEQLARKDEHGRPVKEPVPQRPGTWKYDLEDEAALNKELDKVECKAQAEKDSEDLAEKEVQLREDSEEISVFELPFNALKEDENGDLPITALHLSRFMDVGIIVDDDDDFAEEEPTPISKAKKKSSGKRAKRS